MRFLDFKSLDCVFMYECRTINVVVLSYSLRIVVECFHSEKGPKTMFSGPYTIRQKVTDLRSTRVSFPLHPNVSLSQNVMKLLLPSLCTHYTLD